MLALPEPDEIQELLKVATPQEAAELERLLALALTLDSPLAYAMAVSPATQAFPHTVLLDKYLVALVEHALYPEGSDADLARPDLPPGISDEAEWRFSDRDDGSGDFYHPGTGTKAIYNLAISMPPQHGKSYLVSHHLPAWYLTKYPNRPAAVISYEVDFATTWTHKVRNLIEEHPEYGLELDPATRGKGEWLIKNYGGGILAAGAGGPITGRPTYLMVIDDPLKNAQDAMSEAVITNLHNWWTSTAKTRNQSPRWLPGAPEPAAGVRVLMATRWVQNDLTGYVMKTEGPEWFLLNIPAISEGVDPAKLPEGHKPDPLGRPAGAALAPALHSIEVLESFRESGDPEDPGAGGAFWFEALYQGYPNIEGKGIFAKPFFYYQQFSDKMIFSDGYVCYLEDLRHFATVDLADSVKKRADFTVFMEFAQAPDGRLIVMDIWRERLESPDHMPRLLEWLKPKPRMMFVGIEKVTFGSTLAKLMMRTPKAPPVAELIPDKDKITRAIPAGMAVRNGKVWWRQDQPWTKVFEEELLVFDSGAHDDMVDTLAYGVQKWYDMPQRHPGAPDLDQSQEAKVRRHKEKLLRKRAKSRHRHPQLGRW